MKKGFNYTVINEQGWQKSISEAARLSGRLRVLYPTGKELYSGALQIIQIKCFPSYV